MNYSLEEKYNLIRKKVTQSISKNPLEIVRLVMHKDYIKIHGPEHHFLDGAAFLTAYRNAGGQVDLENGLNELAARSIKMPGGMCGLWGICGSAVSVGAALAILHQTGPLSCDEFYRQHMEFTSAVIAIMSKIGGPRCCKRNAFISLTSGAKFVSERYGVKMQIDQVRCEFSGRNEQCIRERCPYYALQK